MVSCLHWLCSASRERVAGLSGPGAIRSGSSKKGFRVDGTALGSIITFSGCALHPESESLAFSGWVLFVLGVPTGTSASMGGRRWEGGCLLEIGIARWEVDTVWEPIG
jgi:hypothetical protein